MIMDFVRIIKIAFIIITTTNILIPILILILMKSALREMFQYSSLAEKPLDKWEIATD